MPRPQRFPTQQSSSSSVNNGPSQQPSTNNNEVLQRFYSSLERIILFFAFDFTIDWKNIFNRRQIQQAPSKADYSKLRKKCIHKPTVPPRTSPRKHIRANVKSFDEPQVEARKKSSVEVSSSSKSKKNSRNLAMVRSTVEAAAEMPKSKNVSSMTKSVQIPQPENMPSEMTILTEKTANLEFEESTENLNKNDKISYTAPNSIPEENGENLLITDNDEIPASFDENDETSGPHENMNPEENDEDDENFISNSLAMLIQPILDLFSNNDKNDDNKDLTDFNNSVETDQSTDIDNSNVVINEDQGIGDPKTDESMPNPPLSDMDILEEALNESPEKFIETIIAMNDASKIESINQSTEKQAINESFGQQILAEAGAQLIQQENTFTQQQQNVDYSTQKQEKIGSNFCINRTTTFHLDPPAAVPLKL